MARRKRNPASRGALYQIWTEIKGRKGSERLIWEGYGVESPWEVFDVMTGIYGRDIVKLYVLKGNMFHELVQYKNGEVIFSKFSE